MVFVELGERQLSHGDAMGDYFGRYAFHICIWPCKHVSEFYEEGDQGRLLVWLEIRGDEH